MLKVAIVGATGYTGVELLRILARHEHVKVEIITSRSEEGVLVADMYPNLRTNYPDLKFSNPDVERLGQCDVVFFATPHGVAHALAGEVLASGTRVIDLSADFRLQDIQLWEHWYGQAHGAPDLIDQAVYGLPEVNRSSIAKARLVAVPGCYPTSVQLGFLPLAEKGLLNGQHLVASCVSGVSGAGRSLKLGSLFCEANENVMAYAVNGHRHLPEIEQGLNRAAGEKIGLTFVPHLVPMIRGIHSTLYTGVVSLDVDVQQLYEQRFATEPFVDVLPAGSCPQTRSVKGSNICRLAVHRPQGGERVVIMAAIDNLVKGASGQAVQCMNIMFDLPESCGLETVALMP